MPIGMHPASSRTRTTQINVLIRPPGARVHPTSRTIVDPSAARREGEEAIVSTALTSKLRYRHHRRLRMGAAGLRAGRVSVAADHDGRPVPARRGRRHHRSSGGRRDEPRARLAGRRREQGGRRRRHRHELRGQGEARRLHGADGAVVDLDPARGRQGHRPRADVPVQGLRPDRALHCRSDGARRARRQPVEDARRVRRRREETAGRDHLRLVRQLRHDARADGDARGERRGQAAARAVHRRGPRRRRAPRRHRSTPCPRDRRRSSST